MMESERTGSLHARWTVNSGFQEKHELLHRPGKGCNVGRSHESRQERKTSKD